MQVNSIKDHIHQAALRRNGDRGAAIREMLGDPTKSGIYMNMVSGKGIPLNQISEALRNSLSVDDVLSMKAFVELAKFGLRFTEEAAVDDNYRGLIGDSKRVPDKLKREIDQSRKIHRAREHAYQDAMEGKAKNDPFTQNWLAT
jgi:hypothetical protein